MNCLVTLGERKEKLVHSCKNHDKTVQEVRTYPQQSGSHPKAIKVATSGVKVWYSSSL